MAQSSAPSLKYPGAFLGWAGLGSLEAGKHCSCQQCSSEKAPAELVLNFDKPMRITKLVLTDQSGKDYEVQRTDQMKHVLKLVAQLDPVPNGEYKVDWRGLSEDGHPMKGTFSFTVK